MQKLSYSKFPCNNRMKKFIEKLFGINRLKEQLAQLEADHISALVRTAEAKAAEEQAKTSPKERATKNGEPWVSVLQTHVNKENLRNGFFELDWNNEFIVELRKQGYGLEGDPDEQIVDRWFRTLCKDVADQEGIDTTDRGFGYINVQKLDKDRSEIS